MFNFINKRKKIIISTNPKVASSTLIKLTKFSNLEKTNKNKILKLRIHEINSPKHKHYLLVRDPYQRLISCYKDKFIKYPTLMKNNLRRQWQFFHKEFFRYLDIEFGKYSNDFIADKFINTSFRQFIHILPKVYRRDSHMNPQRWIYTKFFQNLLFPHNYIFYIPFFRSLLGKICRIFFPMKIIKIESVKDMEYLAKEVDLDLLNKKVNSTAHIKTDIKFTPDMVKIVNKIYKDDFRLFNYPMR